jgi:hypothetical protein
MQIEIAVVGGHFYDLLQLHQLLALASKGDQALDRANAQPVFVAELHQLRKTRHAAVVVQNLAQHARRLQTCHSGQIHSGLGVTSAPQHAAVFCAQWKYVTRLV